MDRKWNSRLAVFLALGLLSGCIEKTEKITLNPDGSGKSEFDIILAGDAGKTSINGKEQPTPSPQEQLKDVVKHMLHSDHYDAWKDIKYDLTKDGRMHISGVAYFKDFNHRETIMAGGMSTPSAEKWLPIPNSPSGMMLVFDIGNNEERGEPKEKAALPKSEAEITEKTTEAKMGWQQAKPMATAMLATMKLDITYLLPGKVSAPGALQPVPGGVQAVVDGTKMVAAMDKINTDDAVLRASILAGRNPQEPPEDQKGLVYLGRPGKPEAKVEGAMKPLFDYNAEVTAARIATLETMKTLGMVDIPQDVNTADNSGKTPLLRAVLNGDKTLVESLLANGAKIDPKDKDFQHTPLYYAIGNGQTAIAKLLIAKGADVNATDTLGETILIDAAFTGNKEIVELLLAKGADVNGTKPGTETALHHAVRFGKTEIVILLLNHGAKTDALDELSLTPLALASRDKNQEMVDLLKKHGAK